MGNAAGSAEPPAGPAVPRARQPMPAAGELEERFSRALVSAGGRAVPKFPRRAGAGASRCWVRAWLLEPGCRDVACGAALSPPRARG